jgi:hypothetical protein
MLLQSSTQLYLVSSSSSRCHSLCRVNEKLLQLKDQRQLFDSQGDLVCSMQEKKGGMMGKDKWFLYDATGREVGHAEEGRMAIRPGGWGLLSQRGSAICHVTFGLAGMKSFSGLD